MMILLGVLDDIASSSCVSYPNRMNQFELSLDVPNDTIISTDITMIGWDLNHFLDKATMHIYDDDGAF